MSTELWDLHIYGALDKFMDSVNDFVKQLNQKNVGRNREDRGA